MRLISLEPDCQVVAASSNAAGIVSRASELADFWERWCSQPERADRIRLERHHSLNKKGEAFRAAYFVRTGQLKLISTCPQTGDSFISRFVIPGQFIGLEGLTLSNAHLRAIALEDTELSVLPFPSIRDCIQRDLAVGLRLVRKLCEDLQDSLARPNKASQGQDQRFAIFLLQTSRTYQRAGYSGTIFRLGMCRSDIGSYICLADASISRVIRRLNEAGIATIEGRVVAIDRMEKLKLLARGAQLERIFE